MTKLTDSGWRPFADAGRCRWAEWIAKDGWLISYSTSRVEGGEFDGKFVVVAHRPFGENARRDPRNAAGWQHAYSRAFATRKAAKARALVLWRQHNG